MSCRCSITGLVKLEDANNAGTKNGPQCTLILTEGDSAKALAVAGIAVVGRDNYGVFPLRGKLLNVREASGKALLENAEIQAIKQIMGLQHGKVYKSTDSLRYGKLMIMADQVGAHLLVQGQTLTLSPPRITMAHTSRVSSSTSSITSTRPCSSSPTS